MIDQFEREITYLRLSLTERCTLRCDYCRADEGICPRREELNAQEFIRIGQACAKLGIRKIRLTGGEPLLRKDLIEIILGLAAIDGIHELNMTTNAQMLPGQARALKAAGLSRINISLDSLDALRYYDMTKGNLDLVLQSIEESLQAGLNPVRINVVLVRGRNDDEIDNFIELTKERPLEVRFIELMPIGSLGQDKKKRIPSDEILASRPQLQPVAPRFPGQVARDYAIRGYLGRVGFISPVSHQFCDGCNRIRVMSDGMLRPCLGNNLEYPLKEALAEGNEALLEAIREGIENKPVGHNFTHGFKSEKDMSRIGG
ncbi:MAG: 3,8-cyclase [Chloroflexota bacterium]|nr:3,8-cyclase [Chloroflexota bacterium]